MKIPLSKRLTACCQFVAPGDRVADIGCDHGYLSIYLLKNEIASSVIAADINEMPLKSAMNNAIKFGVSDRIRFFLSNGVQSIPKDFDTLVCAGMGADVMVSILEAAPWLRSERYRLILQCQSRTPLLRDYLAKNGWHIRKEIVLRDGRFLYTVMEVVRGEAEILTPGQCYISPALLASGCAELPEYIQWVVAHLELAVNGKGEQADAVQKEALAQLKEIQL